MYLKPQTELSDALIQIWEEIPQNMDPPSHEEHAQTLLGVHTDTWGPCRLMGHIMAHVGPAELLNACSSLKMFKLNLFKKLVQSKCSFNFFVVKVKVPQVRALKENEIFHIHNSNSY